MYELKWYNGKCSTAQSKNRNKLKDEQIGHQIMSMNLLDIDNGSFEGLGN